jgi:type II secretory pathway pseudopilin PulG
MGKRKKGFEGERGFTLVETVVGMLMITMVATGVLSVVLYGQRASVSGEDRLAAMLMLEEKLIDFRRGATALNISQAVFGAPTFVETKTCPVANDSDCPVCPQYGQIDNSDYRLMKTRCFYYKVESLPSTVVGLPTSLKKVTGKIYWEDVSGFKQSMTLETVMTVS